MSERLTPQERALRTITEAAFQKNVIDIARLSGWKVYAPPVNRPVNGHVQNITAGWPDCIFVRRGRLIAAEFKTQVGRATPDQMEWLAALDVAGAETFLWRPKDMAAIVEVLR